MSTIAGTSKPDELPPEPKMQDGDLKIETPLTVEPSPENQAIDAPVIFAHLESAVRSTAISPDGRRMIAGLGNGTLQLFNLISGTPIGQPFQGHQDIVWSVAFSPDGQTIVSGSRDKTIRLWSLEGTPIGQPFQGHQDIVLSVAFSPDGQTIVSGSADKTIR
ncbi:hypothetical protein, partial [Leptolyngbya sp. Heron Island J]|uniref:WD40 repeat domain-containing protein n=1 Tax=Leptolyngbya sp. Heron Island J TaxID=1385935 RepID=UPI0004CF32E0